MIRSESSTAGTGRGSDGHFLKTQFAPVNHFSRVQRTRCCLFSVFFLFLHACEFCALFLARTKLKLIWHEDDTEYTTQLHRAFSLSPPLKCCKHASLVIRLDRPVPLPPSTSAAFFSQCSQPIDFFPPFFLFLPRLSLSPHPHLSLIPMLLGGGKYLFTLIAPATAALLPRVGTPNSFLSHRCLQNINHHWEQRGPDCR